MIVASESNVLVPALGELVIGAIAFGALVFVLMKYAWPMFEQTYAARREAIEGGIRKAEEAQAEADAARSQYQSQLADARGEANRIRDDARTQGAQILAELRAQAQAEAERITSRGSEQLAAERQATLVSLRAEIGTLAVTLAEKIVGERLRDDRAVQATVDRFLGELEAGAASVTVTEPVAGQGS